MLLPERYILAEIYWKDIVNTRNRNNEKKYRDCSEGVDKLKRAYATLWIMNQEKIC